MRLRLLALIVAGCVVAGIPGLANAAGSGPHWIDTLPAGLDIYSSSTAYVELDLDLDGTPDSGFGLVGATTIARSDPSDDSMNYPGLRSLDGHFDVIDTEIASMNLTSGGVTLIAGAGFGQSGVLPASLGAIAEQPGDPTLGDSFFDVYLELDLGGGNYAYNQMPIPIRISTVIDGIPAIATYDSGPVLVALHDSFQGGNRVANLTRLKFTTVIPEPGVLTLLALGGLALLARRRT